MSVMSSLEDEETEGENNHNILEKDVECGGCKPLSDKELLRQRIDSENFKYYRSSSPTHVDGHVQIATPVATPLDFSLVESLQQNPNKHALALFFASPLVYFDRKTNKSVSLENINMEAE